MRTISVRRTAAALAALAAGAAGTVTLGTTTADAATAAPAAAPRTLLTLVFDGCDTCSVGLQHAIDGQAEDVWTSSMRRVGADHQVTFRVPTRLTHGLSFVLDAPWAGSIGAVPNLVTRYAGHDVGTTVDRPEARRSRHAEGCWAGTSAHAATLRFRVHRIHAQTPDGQPTRIPLAYSARTLPSWKPMLRTYKGTIGNQDALYCTPPR